jgi:hypothetical protein
MSKHRKAIIRELVSTCYELDWGTVEGRVQQTADGNWTVGGVELNQWLARYEGQDIVIVTAPLEDERPVAAKTCLTCGTEYVGIACPRCREARIRLRGH